jgi:hypothetical protein
MSTPPIDVKRQRVAPAAVSITGKEEVYWIRRNALGRGPPLFIPSRPLAKQTFGM